MCLVSQGMDPVLRQVGQHIEMEPEWEAAFTLQMKLTNIISMIQDWCSTDVSNLTIFSNVPSHGEKPGMSLLRAFCYLFILKM